MGDIGRFFDMLRDKCFVMSSSSSCINNCLSCILCVYLRSHQRWLPLPFESWKTPPLFSAGSKNDNKDSRQNIHTRRDGTLVGGGNLMKISPNYVGGFVTARKEMKNCFLFTLLLETIARNLLNFILLVLHTRQAVHRFRRWEKLWNNQR